MREGKRGSFVYSIVIRAGGEGGESDAEAAFVTPLTRARPLPKSSSVIGRIGTIIFSSFLR